MSEIDDLKRKKSNIKSDIKDLKEAKKTLDRVFNTLDKTLASKVDLCLRHFNSTKEWKSDKKDEVGKDAGEVYKLIKKKAQEVWDYKKAIDNRIDKLDDDLDDICDKITELENEEELDSDGLGKYFKVAGNSISNFHEKNWN